MGIGSPMRIASDLDGVLARFDEAFMREINHIWPNRLPRDYTPTAWGAEGWGLSEWEFQKVWKAINGTHNWWMGLRPYMDNAYSLAHWRAKHLHDEVFFVTDRTPTEGMTPMWQSCHWLEIVGLMDEGCAVLVKPEK